LVNAAFLRGKPPDLRQRLRLDQPAVQRVPTLRVDCDFPKKWKLHAEPGLAKLLDLTVRARLLAAKIVTGKAEHDETNMLPRRAGARILRQPRLG
jgi:hypothetical protein